MLTFICSFIDPQTYFIFFAFLQYCHDMACGYLDMATESTPSDQVLLVVDLLCPFTTVLQAHVLALRLHPPNRPGCKNATERFWLSASTCTVVADSQNLFVVNCALM